MTGVFIVRGKNTAVRMGLHRWSDDKSTVSYFLMSEAMNDIRGYNLI